MLKLNVTTPSLRRAGGAGQKGGFQNIEEDLWNATKDEVSMDMPEAHESAERGQMAQDGLAGASPEDQTTFPSNVEDQARITTTTDARSSRQLEQNFGARDKPQTA